MFDCGNVWFVKTGVLMESVRVLVRTGDKNMCVREITWWTVCACVRACVNPTPLWSGDPALSSCAASVSLSIRQRESPAPNTLSLSPARKRQTVRWTLPSGASFQRNDMGDRVALLLLAVAASALAAEVRKIRFFSGRICSFCHHIVESS